MGSSPWRHHRFHEARRISPRLAPKVDILAAERFFGAKRLEGDLLLVAAHEQMSHVARS